MLAELIASWVYPMELQLDHLLVLRKEYLRAQSLESPRVLH